ncbi:hypothetical protein [Saliphagus sp. LR7]|uniref:hypothetical protein n=1 Tax=Saliphagus sp. LR7 TaxID=2282654 RepID=UPI000DF7695C|nr:hypothetical protein [Saliphagus sp. LR7]
MIRIIGLVLTGIAAGTYRFLGTHKGERRLNRVLDWATEKYHKQDSYTKRESVIEALEVLEDSRKDGVLVKNDNGFDESLGILKDINPSIFQDIDQEREVVKLERLDRTNYDIDKLEERGISQNILHFIDAVMDDGSRKLVCNTNKVTNEKGNRINNLRNEEIRFKNRLEDRIKLALLGIGAIGFGLSFFSFL